MKATKRLTSLLALLLAVMMLFAACGPAETTSTEAEDTNDASSDIMEEEVAEEEVDDETADLSSEETASKDEDDKKPNNSTNKNSSKPNNNKNSSSKKPDTPSNPSNPQGSGNGTYAGFSEKAEKGGKMYANAPKGEVHVLMWRKYHKSEQLLVDQYQKLTGVKIKTTITSEADYPTKLVSMVSGGQSPDVVMFQSNFFPGLVTKSLQPLNSKYFQLDSDCWNKDYMDAYRINGVYFGVAMPSSWSCEDCTYVTYYSPAILAKAGVKETPYQLYQKKQWNWETQNDIIRKVNAKGNIGLALQSYDMFMLSAGQDFATYNGSKYTNNLGSVSGNSLLTSAWMELSKLKADDCIAGWDISSVQQGKVGLFTAISYGMYNEGDWFPSNFAKKLEVVPVAGPKGKTAYTPVRPKVWGVPKKAKNPEGAAYFLRYFLDTSEFNFKSTFHNGQFEKIYNIITAPSAKKQVTHGSGVSDYVESGTYSQICNALAATSAANITQQLNSKKGSVQTGIARANKDLARIKSSKK